MKKQFLVAALCSASLMFGMNPLGSPRNPGRIAAQLIEQISARIKPGQSFYDLSKDVQEEIKQNYVGTFLELCALEAQNNIMHFAAASAQSQDSQLLNQLLDQNKRIITQISQLQETGIWEFFSEGEIEEFQEGVVAIYEGAWQESGIKIKSSL